MADVIPFDAFRALTVYEDVPAGCKVVMVMHAGFEPHLRVGEFAIVDTADKDVQDGELYAIWIGMSDPHLRIVQAFNREINIPDEGPSMAIRWRFGLPRPEAWVMGDGPLRPQHWPAKCLGRIVGLFQPMRTKVDHEAPYMRRLDGSFAPPLPPDRRRRY